MRLHTPEASVPQISVLDNGCPELLVLEYAAALGWHPGDRDTPHLLMDDPAGKVFKYSKSSMKSYLQCILSLEDLHDRGLESLPVGQLQKYYRCVLLAQQPNGILVNRPDPEYAAQLKALVAGEHAPMVLPPLPLPPPPAPPPLALEDGASDAVLDDESPRPALEDEATSSSSSSSQASGSEGGGVLGDDDDDDERVYPEECQGFKIRLDKHAPRGYSRLQIFCQLHKECCKYRGIGHNQMKTYGWREPLGFLMVWVQKGEEGQSAEEHRKRVKPTRAEIKAWLDANP